MESAPQIEYPFLCDLLMIGLQGNLHDALLRGCMGASDP